MARCSPPPGRSARTLTPAREPTSGSDQRVTIVKMSVRGREAPAASMAVKVAWWSDQLAATPRPELIEAMITPPSVTETNELAR